MRRRTVSTLTVTNPVNQVVYLDVRNQQVSISDNTGSSILANALSPRWGYDKLLQNHVMFVVAQQPPQTADPMVMSDATVAVFRPNQARVKVTTSTKVQGDPGGIAETQAQYSVNGGSLVTIPASVFSTTSHTDVLNSWEYVWPDDYWGDFIMLHFQSRIQPGVGGFHRAAHGPIRLYGAPQ